MKRNKLTSRWFSYLYGLLAFLMLLALAAFGYGTWQSVQDQAKEGLVPHNRSLKQSVSQLFSHQSEMLATIGREIASEPSSRQLSRRLSNLLSATPAMRGLQVVDKQGRILASAGDLEVQWHQLFNDDSQVLLGVPFRSGFLGENLLPLRQAYLNKQGKVAGYIMAAYLIPVNDALDGQYAMLVGKHGQVYLAYPETGGLWQNFLSGQVEESFLTVLADFDRVGSTHPVQKTQYHGRTMLVTASNIPGYQLYAVSGVDYAELIKRWLERMQYVTLAVLLFLFCGLFLFRHVYARASQVESARSEAEHNVSKLSQAIEQSLSSVTVTDQNWVVEYANRRLADEQCEKVEPGQRLLDIYPYVLLQPDQDAIAETLAHGSNWYGERQVQEQKKWFSFTASALSGNHGQVDNFVMVTQDITERKLSEIRLYRQANFDPLTGLPNRRRTQELLSSTLKAAWKNSRKVAVLYMDLDNFKQINDTYGHLLGDELLQMVALRVQQRISQHATVCHMSGDEFLFFTEFTDENQLEELATLIMDALREPMQLQGKKLFVSASVGISRYPADSDSAIGLLKNADMALYESKDRGRSCYSFFTPELDARNLRKNALETEIRHAVEKEELVMVYQTKNDITTQAVYGFEALMRWQSEKLGFIGPDEFIEAAEETGAIEQLGEFALLQACCDLQEFQKQVPHQLMMAVNVSMYQLLNSDIVATVKRVLEKTGIDPIQLELEITESLMAKSMDEVRPVLNALLDLGVSLSIDDFGTGYSSLSYLTQFPVSTLKIDRCFVSDMVDNQSDATLTHTVIAMAHKLGLKVVAEGIEDTKQLALLQVYGCDLGQGYYFSRPLDFLQMREHLQAIQVLKST